MDVKNTDTSEAIICPVLRDTSTSVYVVRGKKKPGISGLFYLRGLKQTALI